MVIDMLSCLGIGEGLGDMPVSLHELWHTLSFENEDSHHFTGVKSLQYVKHITMGTRTSKNECIGSIVITIMTNYISTLIVATHCLLSVSQIL